MHAGCSFHAFEFCELVSSVFSDLALYLAVGGHASTQTCLVEPSWSLLLSCFMHVWHRFLGCRSLEPSCTFFFSLISSSSARDLQHWNLATAQTRLSSAVLDLAIALLLRKNQASACSGPSVDLTWHLLNHLHMSLHLCFLHDVLICGGILTLYLCGTGWACGGDGGG